MRYGQHKPRGGDGQDEIPAPVDLSRLLRPYENQWVALSLDWKEVIAAGDTFSAAKAAADRTRRPVRFMRVLPFDVAYAPTSQ